MSKHSSVYRSIALTLSAVAAFTAYAQDQTDTAPPLYQVEVIVFAYNEADPNEELLRPRPATAAVATRAGAPEVGLEFFDFEVMTDPNLAERTVDAVGAAAESVDDDADEFAAGRDALDAGADGRDAGADGLDAIAANEGGADSADADASTAVERQPDTPFRLRILDRSELQLRGAYDRLQRVDAYTPLLHGGWIQQGLSENEAEPFNLGHLGTFNPVGTVRLHLTRFLHLTLDLDYRPTPLQRTRLPSVGAEPFGLSELSLGPRYPLATGRRIRSRELNYFDHPYFGVLVMVTPYEPEPASSSAAGPAA
jgi:hypothetical protein